MLQIDHLILRVSDTRASAQFYRQVLGLRDGGDASPFVELRIDDGCTIDLLAQPPKDTAHVAFCMGRKAFEEVRERLLAMGIAFGGGPFARDGRVAPQWGARGWADALYFHDPDRHNIEIRTYDER